MHFRVLFNVGFNSPSIIRFLEPLTSDVLKARFEDCHFYHNNFSSIGKEKLAPQARQEITWNNSKLSYFDPRTNQCELKSSKDNLFTKYLKSITGCFH